MKKIIIIRYKINIYIYIYIYIYHFILFILKLFLIETIIIIFVNNSIYLAVININY